MRASCSLLVAVLAAGCAHARGLHAEVVYSGAHCGGDAKGPSVRWIDSEPALHEALRTGGLLDGAAPAPSVDFTREGIALVAAGERPTAGYSVALDRSVPEARRGVVTLVVRFEEPASDALLAQVVTSPCLLARLPREGLREIRVVDPAGALRATARVPVDR